jgi:subtilase family serine protease
MAPDIEILDVRWSPSDPQSGESISFEVEVRNNGSSTAESVGVIVYVAGEYASVPPNFPLEPQEQRWTVESGTNNFGPGIHEAEAVVTDHDSYDFTIQVGSDFGWVTGTVTTEDGTPVDGSRVYLSGDTLSRDGRVENGEFRFDDIPPGDYTVRVSDTKYDGFSREITVSEGSGTDVSGTVEVQTFQLHVEADPVSPFIDGSGEYELNETVVVEAPSEYNGYEFDEWRDPDGDNIWDDARFEVTMNTDRTIIAQYSKPGDPDLRITGISTSPSNPTADDTVSFDIGLENRGETDARNFELQVQTSGYRATVTDLYLDADDDGDVRDIGEWEPDAGSYSVTATVNDDQSIDEESYGNNDLTRTITVEDQETELPPDLALSDIKVESTPARVDDDVEIRASLSNFGDGDVNDVQIDLVVDGTRRDSSYHDVSRDDSKSVAIGTFTPRAPGQLEIVAEVDPDRDITESSESNNTARTTIDVEERLRELPDLAVTSLTTDPSPPIVGQQLQVDTKLINKQTIPASDVRIDLVVDGTRIDSTYHDLSGGYSETVSIGSFEPDSPGEITLEATVDPGNDVEEVTTSNNAATRSVTVEEGEVLDEKLAISSAGEGRTLVTEFESLGLQFQVANRNAVVADVTGQFRLTHRETGAKFAIDEPTTIEAQGSAQIDTDVEIDEEFPNGTYDVTYRLLRDERTIESVTPGRVVAIDIQRELTTTLTVETVDLTGSRIDDVNVDVESREHDVSQSLVTGAGSNTFEELPVGEYTYRAHSADRNQTLEGTFHLTSGETRRELIFEESRPLSGVVLGSEDEPIADARVSIASHDVEETVRTDGMGSFRFTENVPAEDVSLVAETGSDETTVSQNTVFNDHVTVRVDETGELTVGVDDEEGFEALAIGEVSTPVTLIARSPHFQTLLEIHTLPLRVSYGMVRGLVTSLIDMGEGLKETVLALIRAIMDIPGTVEKFIDVLQAVWENRWKAFSYISQTIRSIPDVARQFDEKQQEDNPYDPDGDGIKRYESFKSGWYLGYIGGTLLGGKGLVKVASKGARFFRSFDSVSAASDKAINTLSQTADRAPGSSVGSTLFKRSKALSDPSVRSSAIGGTVVTNIIHDAPVVEAMRQWAKGAYILNHRTRNRKDGKTTNQDEFEGNWDKDPGEISDRALDAVQGAVGEYATVALIVENKLPEFEDIGMNNIMSKYDGDKLGVGDEAIVMTAKLDKMLPEDGELDLVRVRKTADGPEVRRVYEVKTGDQVDARDITKKQDTYERIKRMDAGESIDSSQTLGNSGLRISDFTRGGDPDLKYILPRGGRITGSRSGTDDRDLSVSDPPVELLHRSDEYRQTGRYILGVGEDAAVAQQRKDSLEFLIDPTRTY